MSKIKKIWNKILYYGFFTLIGIGIIGIIAFFWWLDHIRFIY